jgi:hypothetical protein
MSQSQERKTSYISAIYSGAKALAAEAVRSVKPYVLAGTTAALSLLASNAYAQEPPTPIPQKPFPAQDTPKNDVQDVPAKDTTAKPGQDAKDDAPKDVPAGFVKLSGSNLYVPGSLLDDDYIRVRFGIQSEKSGSYFNTQGNLEVSDKVRLAWDLDYAGTKGAEGDADRTFKSYGALLGVRTPDVNGRLNLTRSEKKLNNSTFSSSALSPTLTQDTFADSSDDITSSLGSLLFKYTVDKNLIVEASMSELRTLEKLANNQRDHIYGTTIVGGNPVTVDDTILTMTGGDTRSVEEHFGFGLESVLDEHNNVKARLNAMYNRASVTSFTGLDENFDSWRILAGGQWNGLSARVGYLKQLNSSLVSRFFGEGTLSGIIGQHALAQVMAGADDDGKSYGAILLSFNANRAFEHKDVQRVIAYRDELVDNRIDVGLTADQRRFAELIADESLVYDLGGFTIQGGWRFFNDRTLYSLKAGADLSSILTGLAAFAEYEGGRKYSSWNIGPRVKIGSIWSVLPGTLGVDVTSTRDQESGFHDRAAYLTWTLNK